MLRASMKLLTVTTALISVAGFAHAAGFQLKEQGSALQGLSFAGATAKADDLSTVFFNPAGMTRFKGDHAEVNMSYIVPSTQATLNSVTATAAGSPTLADGDGGDAGGGAFVPSAYALWSMSDDLKVGLAVNAPFGLATEYDDGWAGRYYALKSELKTVAISPSIAYKVNDKLSVGGSIVFQQAEAELSQAVNMAAVGLANGVPPATAVTFADGISTVEGDDTSFGYALGMLYEFDEDSRIGVSYRSKVKHTIKGTVSVTNVPAPLAGAAALSTTGGSADLTTPEILSVGGYHKLNDKFAVMADLSWTNWTRFDYLTVTDNNGLVRSSVHENWKESYFTAVGLEYFHNDQLTYQFGVAYDTSPVADKHRTFRIPDTNRLWVSGGAKYEIDDKSEVTFGYTHIFAENVDVTEGAGITAADAPGKGVVSAEFEANVNILTLGYKRKF